MDRDQRDSSREMGALRVLEDSIVIDTSDLKVDEVINVLKSYLKEN
jgi:cytidylate kinase